MTDQIGAVIDSLVRQIETIEERIEREDGFGTSLYLLVKELETKKSELDTAQKLLAKIAGSNHHSNDETKEQRRETVKV